MAETIWLQDMTWEKVKQAVDKSRQTIILPFGSTEQHGPHLPVGTDTMVALALAKDAAEKTSVPVAPALWFGWSPHHMVLPGTITVRPEILAEIAYDMIASLCRHGFEKFVLINGHRIVNITWMQIAGERAKRELGIKLVIFDPAYMSKTITKEQGWGSVGHAEEIETSHMMYCYPDLVHIDRAIDNPHPEHKLYSVDPSFKEDTLCYVPTSPEEMKKNTYKSKGTVGQPSKASARGGKKYHEHLVLRLEQVIKDLQTG